MHFILYFHRVPHNTQMYQVPNKLLFFYFNYLKNHQPWADQKTILKSLTIIGTIAKEIILINLQINRYPIILIRWCTLEVSLMRSIHPGKFNTFPTNLSGACSKACSRTWSDLGRVLYQT